MTDTAPAIGTVRRTRPVLVLGALGVLLVAVGVVAAGSGQVSIAPAEVLGSLLHRLGVDRGPMPSHPLGDAALWQVRFPRIALAALVGASLGVAGAIMQGVFGNPLAEPSLVGVSSGAAVGACAVIVTGFNAAGSWSVAGGAFVSGLVTCLIVYTLARTDGRTDAVTVVLTGIAVNAVAFGIIAYITFVADPNAREQIVFWQLGSLNGARWSAVNTVFPLVVVGTVVAVALARRLDLLALGERSARHLGVSVEQLRVTAIVVVAVLTSAAVAFTGVIGFIGLLVPHLVRMVTGPSHRVLILGSALAGAVVVVTADLAARTLVDNADLPLGMLTALVGGPAFFWLLRRTRRSQGGWA